jgi:hypothetical protein
MAVFDWGTPPIHSTWVEVATPSSGAVISEIDSTLLGTSVFRTGQSKAAQVTWIVGGSSNGSYLLEQCLSTGLGSTAVRKVVGVYSPNFQSGQYMTRHVLEKDDRLRIRAASSVALAFGHITVEYLT